MTECNTSYSIAPKPAAHVLLHVCCGPCSIVPVLRLREQGLTVSAYFMNPNIHPLAEYLRRREAMVQVAEKLSLPVLWADDSWNIQQWLKDVAGTRDTPPARCAYCYSTRLEATCRAALKHGFSAFSTSLLYSRYQAHEAIVTKGRSLAEQNNIPFFYQDFRTGWQEGIDISKQWNIYRQPYCGCVYSEAERYMKALRKFF
ncbi:MAG: epoxyqueuosine reductase QueH [Desulfovibrionaceae bacterium]